MFKKIFLLVIMVVLLTINLGTSAELTPVCGKTYIVTITNVNYEFIFNEGAFGPGCTGVLTVKEITPFSGGDSLITLNFMQDERLVYVEDSGTFYQTNQDELIYIIMTNIKLLLEK